MKAGDKVRLIGIPPNLKENDHLQTRTLFEKCLGKDFTVAAVEQVDGVPYPLARLDVGHVLGQAPYMQTIWVEEVFLLVRPE